MAPVMALVSSPTGTEIWEDGIHGKAHKSAVPKKNAPDMASVKKIAAEFEKNPQGELKKMFAAQKQTKQAQIVLRQASEHARAEQAREAAQAKVQAHDLAQQAKAAAAVRARAATKLAAAKAAIANLAAVAKTADKLKTAMPSKTTTPPSLKRAKKKEAAPTTWAPQDIKELATGISHRVIRSVLAEDKETGDVLQTNEVKAHHEQAQATSLPAMPPVVQHTHAPDTEEAETLHQGAAEDSEESATSILPPPIMALQVSAAAPPSGVSLVQLEAEMHAVEKNAEAAMSQKILAEEENRMHPTPKANSRAKAAAATAAQLLSRAQAAEEQYLRLKDSA